MTYSNTYSTASASPAAGQVANFNFAGATTVTGGSAAYAIQVANGTTLNLGGTLTVGDGSHAAGVIVNGGTSIAGGTLAFGTSEGIIYSFDTANTISSATHRNWRPTTIGGNTALTLSGAYAVNTAPTTINYVGSVADAALLTGGTTGTGNLVLNDNSANNVTLATGSINNTGTVTNSGVGTATTTISAAIGTNVTNLIQNSATSPFTISGVINPEFRDHHHRHQQRRRQRSPCRGDQVARATWCSTTTTVRLKTSPSREPAHQ